MPLCVCVQVPPALDIAGGSLTEAKTGKVAELHGLNWFGWETDTPGFDGLWVSVWLGRVSWQRRRKGSETSYPKETKKTLAGRPSQNTKEEEQPKQDCTTP